MKKYFLAFALAGCFLSGRSLSGAEITAFDLVKEGNKHVGEEAKGRVAEIRSERSVASLVPNVWYVVYYDPDATAKATEVKFGAGRKLSVKRPARLLQFATGNREMDKAKLKTDSDKALEIARKEPLLEKLDLQSSQMSLQHNSDYDVVWKIRLWAAKLRKPGELADLGQVWVSAEKGTVVKTDLHPDRVN